MLSLNYADIHIVNGIISNILQVENMKNMPEVIDKDFVKKIKRELSKAMQKELGMLDVTEKTLAKEMKVINNEIKLKNKLNNKELISKLRSMEVKDNEINIDTSNFDHDVKEKMKKIHQVSNRDFLNIRMRKTIILEFKILLSPKKHKQAKIQIVINSKAIFLQ